MQPDGFKGAYIFKNILLRGENIKKSLHTIKQMQFVYSDNMTIRSEKEHSNFHLCGGYKSIVVYVLSYLCLR